MTTAPPDPPPAPHPSITVIVPVNAAADLGEVRALIGDLRPWLDGRPGRNLILVVNNYRGHVPPEAEALRDEGVQLITVPQLELRRGEVPPLAARALGARRAPPGLLVHFDADVRVPHAERLLAWYADQFARGAGVAATGIGFVDVPGGWSVRARIAAHHAARWAKRVLMRTAVTRGSNYATDRDLFLAAYDRGMIADELNVGPSLVALGATYAYGGDPELRVLTSARRFRPGWLRLARYLRYRLGYNLRALPPSEQAGERTRRWTDPDDRWDRPG